MRTSRERWSFKKLGIVGIAGAVDLWPSPNGITTISEQQVPGFLCGFGLYGSE